MPHRTKMRWLLVGLSVASLIVCLGSAIAAFADFTSRESFRWIFAIASVGWFVSATVLSTLRERPG